MDRYYKCYRTDKSLSFYDLYLTMRPDHELSVDSIIHKDAKLLIINKYQYNKYILELKTDFETYVQFIISSHKPTFNIETLNNGVQKEIRKKLESRYRMVEKNNLKKRGYHSSDLKEKLDYYMSSERFKTKLDILTKTTFLKLTEDELKEKYQEQKESLTKYFKCLTTYNSIEFFKIKSVLPLTRIFIYDIDINKMRVWDYFYKNINTQDVYIHLES